MLSATPSARPATAARLVIRGTGRSLEALFALAEAPGRAIRKKAEGEAVGDEWFF
jgi:hypothetical protein